MSRQAEEFVGDSNTSLASLTLAVNTFVSIQQSQVACKANLFHDCGNNAPDWQSVQSWLPNDSCN